MLELLLAKLGIPLEEAQRSYAGEGCERGCGWWWWVEGGGGGGGGGGRRLLLQTGAWLLVLRASCREPTPPHPSHPNPPWPADDMAPRYRASLQEKLEVHAPAFRMSDVTFKSFQLQDGLKRCVNAVDLVHAVTALLECGSRTGPATAFGDHVDKFW